MFVEGTLNYLNKVIPACLVLLIDDMSVGLALLLYRDDFPPGNSCKHAGIKAQQMISVIEV